MNWIDLVFIALIVISGLISLYRGFVREIFSLATWIIAAWVGIQYSSAVAVYLPEGISDVTLRLGLAFAGIFILVLILGGIAGVLANRIVRGSGLTGTDRSLGVVFGVLRGALIVTVLVFVASLTLFPEESWWQESAMVPHFERVVDRFLGMLPEPLQERLQGLNAEADA